MDRTTSRDRTPDLGTATIEVEQPVVAGTYFSVRWIYTVGHPIDDGGHILIAFRHCGDFGTPQFQAPREENYCLARTSGDCSLEPRWEGKGHVRPWTQCVVLTVCNGYLDSGQVVQVQFGETSGGSPGWRFQTFPEASFEFKTLIDPLGTQLYRQVPRSPALKVVAGTVARCSCIAPSTVLAGDSFQYYIRLEDRWGNVVGVPKSFEHEGFSEPGVCRVLHQDPTSQEVVSNPVLVVPSSTAQHHWWADFHGQSEETIGTNSIGEYFRAGRDLSLLDILSHQGNDFQVSDHFWSTVEHTAELFNRPGRFVTFPGYEWSGNTPLGGDRNVFFGSPGGSIYRSSLELVEQRKSRFPVAATATDLFRLLRDQRWPDHPPTFVFAHVGGRYANMEMHDSQLETAVEIHSAWGTFEWLLEESLARGYRVGVVANSDDHRGAPGASYPGASGFGSLGGLTCVLCNELDRTEVIEALRQRHTYATTGNRCLLHVAVRTDDGIHAIMGDVVTLCSPCAVLRVWVAGTGPIERVDVLHKERVIHTYTPTAAANSGRRVKIAWQGAARKGRGRAVQWDGEALIAGNSVEVISAVNFWNPDKPVRQRGAGHVTWESTTTGGVAGVILALAHPAKGDLRVVTKQGTWAFCLTDVLGSALGVRWQLGPIGREFAAVCLPDEGGPLEASFEVTLDELAPGDNPVYVRVVQEDGHLAWSSPLFLEVPETCQASAPTI